MTEWSVALGFRHDIPTGDLTDKVDDLLEAMAPYHAAASFTERGMTVQFTVEARTMRRAMDEGVAVLEDTLHTVGIKDDGIFAGRAQKMEHLDPELSLPNARELLGVIELANLLNVSRQRASELARTGSGFPRPIVLLASGPVWDRAMIARYVEHWDRRPRGRPRKKNLSLQG